MKAPVKLDGFKELNEALYQFAASTGRRVLNRAVQNAAETTIAARARQLAPDDPKGPAKDLKRSILVVTTIKNTVGNAEYSAVMRGGGTKKEAAAAMRAARRAAGKTRGQAIAVIGPEKGRNSRVGALQEYGTVNHSPQPFMRPAFDLEKQNAIDAIATDLKSEIEKAAARAAARAANKKPKGK